MPPAPNSARISYGPKRAPDFNAMSLDYTPRNRRLAHEAAEGVPEDRDSQALQPRLRRSSLHSSADDSGRVVGYSEVGQKTGFWEVPPGFTSENLSKRGSGQPGS